MRIVKFILILTVALIASCGGKTSKQSDFTFQGKYEAKFSPRSSLPEIGKYDVSFPRRPDMPVLGKKSASELKRRQMSYIGTLSAEQIYQVSYKDGETTAQEPIHDPLNAMLEEAKDKGADLVIINYHQRLGGKPVSKRGECISWGWRRGTSLECEQGGCIGGNVRTCDLWETIAGTKSTNSTQIQLWRDDPLLFQEEQFIQSIESNDVRTLRRMIAAGFAPSQKSVVKRDYLSIAIKGMNANVVGILLDNGISPQVSEKELLLIAQKDDGRITALLLEKGLPHESISTDVIREVAKRDNLKVLKAMEAAGVDILRDGDAFSAASFAKKSKTSRYLFSKMEKRDAQQSRADFNRAFNAAVMNRDWQLVRRFIEKGADANYVNGLGVPVIVALFYEGEKVDIDILKLLVEHGADVNATTKRGNTALMGAADIGDYQAVSYLLQHGANPNLSHHVGNKFIMPCCTALDIARFHKQSEIEELLLNHGAKASPKADRPE